MKGTEASPALKQMRKTWRTGALLWHTGLFLLLTSLIMQFIVIGTTELVVGETPVAINKLPLFTSIRKTYGVWRSCFELWGLELPSNTEDVIGCFRPDNTCPEIYGLYQLNQAFSVLGVTSTTLGILVHIVGIARRGSCFRTMLVTWVLGFLSMGFTLTIWAVAVGLKNITFCSDAFPVLKQVERSDYKYGASFTIAVIDWIMLVLYLLNQVILANVVRGHSKPIPEQVDVNQEETTA